MAPDRALRFHIPYDFWKFSHFSEKRAGLGCDCECDVPNTYFGRMGRLGVWNNRLADEPVVGAGHIGNICRRGLFEAMSCVVQRRLTIGSSDRSIHVVYEGPGRTEVTLRRDGSVTVTSLAIPGARVWASHYMLNANACDA